MSSEENTNAIEVQPVDKAKVRHLLKVMWILAGVTVIEFIFAFTMDRSFVLVSIFVLLTIVKAFYIVSEFMHLGHEVKSLMYSIVLPMLFVVWLIIALIYEGSMLHTY
ncbi:MAG: cytochrome C oxidase subunit IV family protein [Cyclobacteriaceae bacterium]|nr:cytochrome C oxidase subunit IV family protein [Cyclobacteriaceae bacterium]